MILRLMFALVLILAGLGMAPVAFAEQNKGWGLQLGLSAPMEQNTDRPGGDFTNFEIQPTIGGLGTQQGVCQNACVSNSSCRAWTLVKAGIQGPKARCWLKSSVPAKRVNGCCTSGVER